jgi:hypothetical protein
MIIINSRDEHDLCWYFNEDYKGDLGFRSTHGGIQDTLERGTSLGSSGVNPGVSERSLNAAKRLRLLLPRVRRLTPSHIQILRAAFTSRSDVPPLCYGTFPTAVLGCSDVIDLYRHDGHSDPSKMTAWLWSLQGQTTAKKEATRVAAANLIEGIKQATEKELLAALQAYGADARIPPESGPTTVNLTDMMIALRMDRRTILAKLDELGMNVETRKGATTRIPFIELKAIWPEAAHLISGIA